MSELHVIYTPTGWETSSVVDGVLREKVEDLNLEDLLKVIDGYDYAYDEAVVVSVGHLRFLLESMVYKTREEELLKGRRSAI